MNPTPPRLIALLLFLGTGVCGQYDQYGGYTTAYIGDGRCDEDVNNAEWGYDGGDCCYCSCVDGPDYSCGVVGFDCRDPEYMGDEVSDCTGELAVDALCSTDISTQLVVNDTASATALANAIRCSGGTFSVRWVGSVDVSQTIKVTNGTVLHVAGVSPGAAVQGASGIRLFTVINASLELENIAITGGYATFGGAIAAANSYISVKNASFTGNDAIHEGGALYATLGSIASFGERIIFDGNHAHVEGGALSFEGASSVSFQGYTLFSTCTTDGNGGALSVSSSTVLWTGDVILSDNYAGDSGGAMLAFSSNVSLSGDTVFSNNTAHETGGALYVSSSEVSWSGDARFHNNTAIASGGALSVYFSDVSWSGDAVFSNNTADGWGGALRVYSSDVSWSGDAVFSNNTAVASGGALYVYFSDVSWSGDAAFSNNTADGWGGALRVSSSDVSWSGDAVFSNNTAVASGGALYVYLSDVSWSSDALFFNNIAYRFGGALYISSSAVFSSGDAVFSNNTAYWSGGALSIFDTNMSWSGDVIFSDNTANHSGGALSVLYTNMSWSGDALFSNNIAYDIGGALSVYLSNVSWSDDAVFSNNTAYESGGALFISSTNMSWSGDVLCSNNTAYGFGGALYAASSAVFSSGDAFFFSNTAYASGGALYANEASVSWSGDAVLSNNSAHEHGGALYANEASVSWSGDAIISSNTAGLWGGALLVRLSSLFWPGNAVFSNNTAGWSGGALYVYRSDVSRSGNTVFFNNTAEKSGGALYVLSSDMSWSGEDIFRSNTADGSGGALHVSSSELYWSGNAMFSNNTADRSGGASFVSSSGVFWSGDAVFTNNTAEGPGGALYVHLSEVSWSGDAVFSDNGANGNGGALYISNGARVLFESGVVFLRNSALGDGGAAFVYSNNDTETASICVNSTTVFEKNSCRGDGGGLAMVAEGKVVFATTNVTFSLNSANVAGGAVAVKGLGVGPLFKGLTFASNHAQIGGAAYITSSGTAVTEDQFGVPMKHPTTFDRCMFIGNEAGATGGAITTGAGLDVIANTYFANNIARAGGALSLAGIASLRSSSFTENTSENGEGSAVVNSGFVSSITECSFVNNTFKCEPGEFMDYEERNTSNGVFDVVCKGCSACDNCSISRRIPVCSKALRHTKSAGGNSTIEALQIDAGYWRATNTSRKVLKCYNEVACFGGKTGALNFCSAGYEGPYCSICRDGYSPSLGYTCNKCSEGIDSVVVAAVIIVLIVIISAILVVVLLLFCLMRDNSISARRGLLESWRQRLLSLKIIVIVWQITTQFSSVANVRYPGVYQRYLDGVDILNFDISKVLSVGCIFDLDFHHRLFISTLGPAVALTVFGVIYAAYIRINRPSYYDFAVAVRERHQKCTSVVLVLTFLVYSSVSSTLFQMFACDELDDGKSYLRADYRIDCNSSTHRSLQVYAAFMMLVYPAGIPVLYGILLFRRKEVLLDESIRQEDSAANSISSLWKLYKPHRFYYELIECARRILLSGIVVFAFPNTVAQVGIAFMMATFFMVLSEMVAPYESLWDTWINRIGHAIVFGAIYLALLLRTDLSDERVESKRVFGALLVAGQVIMVLLVTSEAIVVTYQWIKRTR